MTIFRTILFLIFVPGVLLLVLPLWIMQTSTPLLSLGIFRWLALPFWAAGAGALLWSAYDFLVRGRGTPAPIDPPKELVLHGLYQIVRNPMYVGGLLILLGHILWFPSSKMIVFMVLFFSAVHLFVTFYEEPHLRKVFGPAYLEYCQRVPRWIPRFHN